MKRPPPSPPQMPLADPRDPDAYDPRLTEVYERDDPEFLALFFFASLVIFVLVVFTVKVSTPWW
jgi:hypothetical protein